MLRLALRAVQLVTDTVALAAALVLAYGLRFDWEPPPRMVATGLILAPYVIAAQLIALALFGVHRFPWRHVGLREATRVAAALAAAATVFLVARISAEHLQATY
ncbi:MAG: hypothetical protein RMK74_10495, partial [Myxococcales bacterium]|nr:hypothetical protein [Myxococcales bacterium]